MVTEERGASPEAVGEAIRQLREASGWSREALAAELKIAVRQLAALEAGQWRELPNAIFVRGVLKGIARWGNRDPQPWLEVAQACFAESTVRLTPPSNAEGEIVVRRPFWRHPVVRFAGGVVVVGLLLVGYLQWFGVWESDLSMTDGVSLRTPLVTPNGETNSAVVVLPSTTTPGGTHAPTAETPPDSGTEKAVSSGVASRSDADGAEAASKPDTANANARARETATGGFADSAKMNEPTAAHGQANPVPAQQTATAVETPRAASDQGAASAANVAPEEAAQPKPTPSPQQASGLAIRAEKGDSWMRITAKDGTKVYDGILRQGDSRTFPTDGAPYALHLGNAQALVIEWNGTTVEPPSRGVVRLQVPAQP